MLRFAKWAVVPAVVGLAVTFGSASEAKAGGWGFSIGGGYPGYGGYYNGYNGYYGGGFTPGYSLGYGYGPPVGLYRYRAYYPSPAIGFSFGGGGGFRHHHRHHCR